MRLFTFILIGFIWSVHAKASVLIPVHRQADSVFEDAYIDFLHDLNPRSSRSICRTIEAPLNAFEARGRLDWALKCLEQVDDSPIAGERKAGLYRLLHSILHVVKTSNERSTSKHVLYPVFGDARLLMSLTNGGVDDFSVFPSTTFIHYDQEDAACEGFGDAYLIGLCTNREEIGKQ